MKKIALLLCLFAAAITQAQTKEETIAWINTYSLQMLNWPNNGVNNVSVTDDGILTIHSGAIGQDGIKRLSVNNILHIKDILIPKGECIFQNGEWYDLSLQTSGAKIRIYNGNYVSEIRNLSSKDKNNIQRLANSIFHLAKLFGATPAVSKDTF